VIRLLQLIAAPLGWLSRRSWAGVLAVRVLPKRLRIAVVDALDGHALTRANFVLTEGGVSLDLDTSDDVDRRVLLRGYEVEELDLLPHLVGPGDTCVDVGANMGLYTVHLGHLVGEAGKVLAFEADPRNAERLRRNVALNGFQTHVSVHEVAVMDAAGTVEFNLREDGFSGHGSVHRYPGHVSSVSVPAMPLDSILQEAGVGEVALLKVDVEGADMDVYAGARGSLERQIFRTILAEWNGFWFPGLGWSVERFVKFFAEFGYRPAGPNLRGWERLMEDPVGRESWIANVILERS
jgi:FkbM family methyltransferase